MCDGPVLHGQFPDVAEFVPGVGEVGGVAFEREFPVVGCQGHLNTGYDVDALGGASGAAEPVHDRVLAVRPGGGDAREVGAQEAVDLLLARAAPVVAAIAVEERF